MEKGGGVVDGMRLATFYVGAKEHVIEAGFADEIDWQDSVSLGNLTESRFLREAAWVVLCTGFRESVVRSIFGRVSEAFLYWSSADRINAHGEACRANALAVFHNVRKIDAIMEIVVRVAQDGMSHIRREVSRDSTRYLQELPYVGPVTARHLAKNLGFAVAKEDRHLSRLARMAGHESADCMCRRIAEIVGDSVGVVDIVLWRYMTLVGTGGIDFENSERRLVVTDGGLRA